MKARSVLTIILAALLGVVLPATGVFAASDVTLTVGEGTGTPGGTVQIPVTVASVGDPVDLAGAAFTLQYDTALISIEVESTFFDTFAVQFANTPAAGQDSVTIGEDTYYQPLITNPITEGLRIAAARAAAEEINDTATTIFTLNISYIGDCDPPITPIPINVVSTELNNTDAGYDAGGETIPMLVGADPTIADVTDPAAYPILLDPPPSGSIGSTVNGQVTFGPCSGYEISGSVSYNGSQTGTLYVAAFADSDPNTPVGSQSYAWAQETETQDFTIPVLANTYTVKAFIDSDNSGATMDAWEANGSQSSIAVTDTSIDIGVITLSDPQGDKYPLFYEHWVNAHSFWDMTDADDTDEGPNDDWDDDGHTNIEELELGSDPTDPCDPDPCGNNLILHALGRDLGVTKEYTAELGIGSTAETLPSPPAPPEYTVLMELFDASWNPLSKDIRLEGEEEYCWVLGVNPHGNMPPPTDASSTVSWDPAALNYGFDSYQVLEGFECSGPVVVSDMTQQTEFTVTGGNQPYYYSIVFSDCVDYDLDLRAGWNLVSIPVDPLICPGSGDNSLDVLIPDAEVAYKYDGAYVQATELYPCEGYWVKVPADQVYTIRGKRVTTCPASMSDEDVGWHLMGSVYIDEFTPTTDPEGSIEVIFGYSGAYYQAIKMEDGNGYWVKFLFPCEYSLSAE